MGAVPNTAWLRGSTLALGDGVLCDDGCVTALLQVAAVGDVAGAGGVRAEHGTSATERARAAVTNLLAGRTLATLRPVPCFWSDQYGSRIQFAGRYRAGDTVGVTEGELSDEGPGDGGFLARYEREGTAVAVLAVDRPRPFTRARRALGRAVETATT
ncbi:oxidoreductase C-terminal domain-containing protein [Streptomyces griseoluteus]|uniref:oxidoreductase C-terminal domain-containing protein n=1 Tax=Streptomyces griseoluteus TaxID=29306 RepID=UPI0036A4ACED